MRRFYLVVIVICLIMLLSQAVFTADEQVLWQIGTPDNSYSEFAVAGHEADYLKQFSNDVTFEVGKSDPGKDWPYIHPGPVDAWARNREHPFKIVFDLPEQPGKLYALKIDLVDVHSSYPPSVKVAFNDRNQVLDPEQGKGDASLSNPNNGREQAFTLYVSGKFLHQGKNTITLIAANGSWVLYDCISLINYTKSPPLVSNLTVRPTFMFKNAGKQLNQVLFASMDLCDDPDEINIEATGEQGWQSKKVYKDVLSGRQNLEIEVPEVTQPQKVRIKLTAAGQVQEAECTVTPQKKWRVYLLPSTHFDLGYTSIQSNCLKTHRENLDRAMDWCAKYPEFIWNTDASYLAQDYLANGSRTEEFLKLTKKGRIGIQGLYGNELTGICSSEGLVRLGDYYDFLRKEYGIQSECAMLTDVPTITATLPMVLAGHGIKYLSHGINATRALGNQEPLRTPHYWESPDGSRILLWKTNGYGESGSIIGYGEGNDTRQTRAKIDALLQGFTNRQDYPFDALLLHGAYGDNQPNSSSIASVAKEWNRTYAYPKIITSKGTEFFKYIEANFADKIKTVKGDGGVYWEDGAASSAYETAITRVAKEEMITAEKLAILGNNAPQSGIERELSTAWENALLYDEHTWGAAQSIDAPDSKETREQWTVKKSFAVKARKSANNAFNQACDSFFSQIKTSGDGIVVFNPSSWTRSGIISLDNGNGNHTILNADSVPAMGYKVFSPADLIPDESKVADGDTLENKFYAVKFDKSTGAVSSIFDKELNRELLESSGYGANSYLYVSGQTNSLVLWGQVKESPLTIETTSDVTMAKFLLPGRQVMNIKSKAPMTTGFKCQIVLYDSEKRIDFINTMDKTPTTAKEAGYFAFPFAFTKPEIRLEIPSGVIKADVDQIKAACRDWYAVQHFLSVSDDNASVVLSPIDSPLVTLQDINRGQWYQHLDIKNGHVYAYVFNNYWFTNYKASQSGPLTFRFALTSGKKIDDLQAKKFGESVQSPMVCKTVTGKPGSKSAVSTSLLNIEGDGIVLQALKSARFTKGTIIRLREMNGKTTNARLQSNGVAFKQAYLCNLAEDKISRLKITNGTIEVPCKALGLTTVLLER